MSEEGKTPLSVAQLLSRGFVEFDGWLVTQDRLHAPRNLPAQRGVYAFAVDNQVMYIGLASRSIKQRLGFYIRPGAGQLTNVRLNSIIRQFASEGHVVRVLIAHPPDLEWNGFRMSGPEALEAALIEDFSPPWNRKGAASLLRSPSRTAATNKGTTRLVKGAKANLVIEFVRANPGCTELQIAQGVIGPNAKQPQVNQICRKLVEQGQLRRLPTRPVIYEPR